MRVGNKSLNHILMKTLLSIALLGLGFGLCAEAQTLSPWEVNTGEGVINLPNGVKSRKGAERLSIVYDYAKIPDKTAAGWKLISAPNGNVAYSTTSILDKAKYDQFTQLDLTYFRGYLTLPNGFKLNKATVTIGNVDDQARMLVFNSLHPKGYYVEANDGKRGGQGVTTDFTGKIAVGEVNTFIIVQVDDNCCGNNLTGGISVQINDQVIKPTTTWAKEHTEFLKSDVYIDLNNLRAYSINGGGYSDSQPYGVTTEGGDCVIRTLDELSAEAPYLSIIKKQVGNSSNNKPVFVFQVMNSGPNTYLVPKGSLAQDNRITTRQFGDVIPDEAKFYEESPLFSDPKQNGFNSYQNVKFAGSYLRHQGKFLEIDPKGSDNVYIKDATWRIEKLK